VNSSSRKVFHWVAGIHIVVLSGLLIVPWVRDLFRPKPKEIITYITLEAPAPEFEIIEQPIPEPVPEPAPAPKPEPIPEPPKEPEKPKWKPAKVERQDKRTTRTTEPVKTQPKPKAPRINAEAIRKAIQGGVSDPNAWYYDLIYQRMYAVWNQPGEAGGLTGLRATAEIRIERDGTVSARRLTVPSGHSAFDQSVQAALNAVARLPAPPDELAGHDIEIEFVLSN